MNSKTRKLTLSAMFAALAYLLMLVGRLPITSLPFLKYDPKDMVLVVCGFVQGPAAAAAVTILVNLIELVTVSASGFIGFVMNTVSSLAFVLPAALFYRKSRRLRSAVVGLIISTLLMTAVMLLWNHFLSPLYMGMPQDAVDAMLIPIFLPFNLIKGALNTAFTLIVYKPLARGLRSAHLLVLDEAPSAEKPKKTSVRAIYIGAAALIVVCVIAILLLKGII